MRYLGYILGLITGLDQTSPTLELGVPPILFRLQYVLGELYATMGTTILMDVMQHVTAISGGFVPD